MLIQLAELSYRLRDESWFTSAELLLRRYAGLDSCPAVTAGNTIKVYALMTDFKPEFNPDFDGPRVTANTSDKGIVTSHLDGAHLPVYAGLTPTTSGMKLLAP